MITPVNPLLEDFAKSGSDIITFHPEAEDDPKQNYTNDKIFWLQSRHITNQSTP